MQDRENRFILDNIFEEDVVDVPKEMTDESVVSTNNLESFEKYVENNNDNFINSFKLEVPSIVEVGNGSQTDVVESSEDIDNRVNVFPSVDIENQSVGEEAIEMPVSVVEEVKEDTTENNIDTSDYVYDAVSNTEEDSTTVKEAFEAGRNLQDMINKILKIDGLEPVKVEIAGVNNEKYEEEQRVLEELELKKKEQDNFQNEISEVMRKDTTEVVFKSDLLDRIKKEIEGTNEVSMLARYGEDYCSKEFVTNPAIGRDNEIKQLILTLLTPEKSAILIGKPGIGKTSIVEGLAYRLERGLVPDALKGYTIINIKTPSLLGTLSTGETRLQTLVDELKKLDKVILFIDEIHMLIGATNDSSLDFANMFKEGLGRGQIKVIGATTTEEYERYILRDKAFVRRFQSIEVLEPTREHTIKILMGTLPKIEKETGAKMKYTSFIKSEIMAFIVDITSEYKRVYGIGSRYPDICLNLLKEAFSQCIFKNRKEVSIFDVKNAILNSKNIYPDVIRKEIVNFDEKFKKIMDEEFIDSL